MAIKSKRRGFILNGLMNRVELYPYQEEALGHMHNACILCGEVGTGKSRTAIAYYTRRVDPKKKIYVCTTAKKRDSKEWEEEFKPFGITNYIVDSWNNIKKYSKVTDSFFIFDEQRVVGRGAWVKSFLKIAKNNEWILLSATPGDTWSDYIPVFIANGFYKNRSEFSTRHIVYKPYMNYPVIDKYISEGLLIRHRNEVLVMMHGNKRAVKVKRIVTANYDRQLYKTVMRDRWDPYDNEPITETGKLFYLLRKVVNSDESRVDEVRKLLRTHKKTIIFYNFTYELNILRGLANELCYDIGEWNGERHTEVPTSDKWVYLVQYTAGSEGWNCITTNVIIFYSQSYSYRTTVQAAGRIDRVNTPFKELYYYTLKSSAPIDLAIARALSKKQNFNENAYLKSRK